MLTFQRVISDAIHSVHGKSRAWNSSLASKVETSMRAWLHIYLTNSFITPTYSITVSILAKMFKEYLHLQFQEGKSPKSVLPLLWLHAV